MSSSEPPPGGHPPQGPPPGQPPGGYPPQGPPPGGGYPPPPGYGYQGYGPGAPRFSIGEAFNYGWTKFQQNVGTIILAALAWIAILAVFNILWVVILGAVGLETSASFEIDSAGNTTSTGGGFWGVVMLTGLLSLAVALVGLLMQAGIIRGALQLTYGRELRVGTTFTFPNLGAVILSALIVAVMTAVGFALCYIPGLIVVFFTQFTMFFLIDRDMGALDAIKASASFVNRNLGTLIGFYIASIIAYFVGALLCGIGLLVAIPVVIIAQTYAYRVLQGEAVAP